MNLNRICIQSFLFTISVRQNNEHIIPSSSHTIIQEDALLAFSSPLVVRVSGYHVPVLRARMVVWACLPACLLASSSISPPNTSESAFRSRPTILQRLGSILVFGSQSLPRSGPSRANQFVPTDGQVAARPALLHFHPRETSLQPRSHDSQLKG